jgi:hypothetical protein
MSGRIREGVANLDMVGHAETSSCYDLARCGQRVLRNSVRALDGGGRFRGYVQVERTGTRESLDCRKGNGVFGFEEPLFIYTSCHTIDGLRPLTFNDETSKWTFTCFSRDRCSVDCKLGTSHRSLWLVFGWCSLLSKGKNANNACLGIFRLRLLLCRQMEGISDMDMEL